MIKGFFYKNRKRIRTYGKRIGERIIGRWKNDIINVSVYEWLDRIREMGLRQAFGNDSSKN